jgi:hypothetical protein
MSDDAFSKIIIAIPIIIVSTPIAFFLNARFNPPSHKPFKYGYFLSVGAIIQSLLIVILSFYDEFSNSYYGPRFSDFLSLLLVCCFFVLVAVLNIKKYRLGAVLVLLLTLNIVIGIPYYRNRWDELKTFGDLVRNLKRRFRSFENPNNKTKIVMAHANGDTSTAEKLLRDETVKSQYNFILLNHGPSLAHDFLVSLMAKTEKQAPKDIPEQQIEEKAILAQEQEVVQVVQEIAKESTNNQGIGTVIVKGKCRSINDFIKDKNALENLDYMYKFHGLSVFKRSVAERLRDLNIPFDEESIRYRRLA